MLEKAPLGSPEKAPALKRLSDRDVSLKSSLAKFSQARPQRKRTILTNHMTNG